MFVKHVCVETRERSGESGDAFVMKVECECEDDVNVIKHLTVSCDPTLNLLDLWHSGMFLVIPGCGCSPHPVLLL